MFYIQIYHSIYTFLIVDDVDLPPIYLGTTSQEGQKDGFKFCCAIFVYLYLWVGVVGLNPGVVRIRKEKIWDFTNEDQTSVRNYLFLFWNFTVETEGNNLPFTVRVNVSFDCLVTRASSTRTDLRRSVTTTLHLVSRLESTWTLSRDRVGNGRHTGTYSVESLGVHE